jgi:hypothetical protein
VIGYAWKNVVSFRPMTSSPQKLTGVAEVEFDVFFAIDRKMMEHDGEIRRPGQSLHVHP